MVDKVQLTNLGSIQNDPSATGVINANNAALITAMNNTLSRTDDGVTANYMSSRLDMGNYEIVNVGPPNSLTSAVRVKDVVSNPSLTIPTTGTSGHAVPYLDGANAWSGTNSFSTTTTFTGPVVLPQTATGYTQTNATNNTTVATTAYVNNVLGAFGSSVTGLSVLGNAGTTSAAAASITGTADQILAVNHAGTSLGFESVSGDLTMQGGVTTLATVNSNVGSFGSASSVPAVTVNAKGLVTAVSTNAVVAPAGTLSGTTLASGVITSSIETTAASLALGTDSATPSPASISANSALAGSTNTPGVDLTIEGSKGTGTGAGGNILFQTAAAGSTGTTQNSLSTRAEIDSKGNVVVGSSALATTATDGFLYIPTCAGIPTGTPTAFGSTVPIIYDTTDNKIYVHTSLGWKATAALA